MSVLIKGFPLPNNCGACPLRLAWCRERIYMAKRPERCPLVPIPPHGTLIEKYDIFKLISAFPDIDKLLTVEFMKALYNLRTIIHADLPKEKTTNFCADCLWYETAEMYCLRQGNHSHDACNCVLWEPKAEPPKKEGEDDNLMEVEHDSN